MDKILVIAAHPDDEVLGCGGTIARLARAGAEIRVITLADGEGARSVDRNRDSQLAESCKILGLKSHKAYNLKDNRLDSYPLLEIVKIVEAEVKSFSPDTIFTHSLTDLNVDHQITHKAVLTACRPLPSSTVRSIFAFEVPSSTEWQSIQSSQFNPNYFFDISKFFDLKLQALNVYSSEMREFPHPRSFEGVEALGKWRGVQSGVEMAESFILIRKIEK